MPRKKKVSRPRANTRKKTKNKLRAPLWAWLVMGLLLAAVITLLIYLMNQAARNAGLSSGAEKTAGKQALPQPRFDFYEILKQQQVDVPDRSAEVKAAVAARVDYYLQVASFRQRQDADQLRARLILLNLDTEIETVKNNAKTWHRVVVGPFNSRSKMAKARSTLASMELHALLLTR